MLKKMMLLLVTTAVFAGPSSYLALRDLPQPPCWPCTSLR